MNWFNWLKVRKSGPKFEPRPDISNKTTTTVQTIEESVIVKVDVVDFEDNVFGRTHVVKGQLHMDFDTYLQEPAILLVDEIKKRKQCQQTALHEMMHVALWTRLDITHSQDTKSILYYKVTGANLVPTEQDKSLMLDAASKIKEVVFKTEFDVLKYWKIDDSLTDAVRTWNDVLGREFFKVSRV